MIARTAQNGRHVGGLIIEALIRASGFSAIAFVLLIFAFLLREGLPAFWEVDAGVLFSARWYPIEGFYGLLPLILGSMLVTLGAAVLAVPKRPGR